MRHVYIYIFLCVVVFTTICTSHVIAQSRDTLSEVTVSHTRNNALQQTVVFDSAQKARSAGMTMADMINASGVAYVKQYGPGNISTANLRGGSSYHTTLLWNGLNIANPMLGNADLSLIPSLFADVNQVQFGGNSSLWGSGSVAGSFQLENTALFIPGLSIMAGSEYASLHTLTTYGKLDASNEKLSGSFRFFTQNGKNEYSYYNKYTQQTETLQHAATHQYALFGKAAYKINTNNTLHLVSFVNRSDRDIAPLLTEKISTARQLDENLRALFYWKKYMANGTLIVRTAALADRLVYSDSLRNIDDDSRSIAIPVEAEWKTDLHPNHSLLLYAGYRPVIANYPGENENIIQQNFSGLARWNFKTTTQKIYGGVGVRYEKQNSRQPVTGTADITFQPVKSLQLNLRAATLYRLPTLNDLYWPEAGNPDLKPEKGYSVDGSATFSPKLKNNSVGFSLEGRVFYRNVNDWIQWMPTSTFWTPRNIEHVESYGSESTTHIFARYKTCMFSVKLNTLYTVSHSLEGPFTNRQLIYSPMYSGNIQTEISTKRWWIAHAHFYTGYRYTSADNYSYLTPYYFAQTEAGGNIFIQKIILSLSAGVKNLFDEPYQSITNRPMPGRWYFIRLQIHFKK